MKRYTILFAALLLFACGENVEKPERLLEKDEMVNIFYDLTLLQAIKSYQPKILIDNKVEAKEYVYRKYDIDSTVFAQNHRYYASRLEDYTEIQDKVNERIKKEKEKVVPAVKPGEKENKAKDSAAPKKPVLKKNPVK